MRIAHAITKLDVGGAQTHVVELALGQAAAGDRVEVIAGTGGAAAERLVAAGIPVRIVPDLGASHGRVSQRASVAAMGQAVRLTSPDLVHSHSSNAGLAARLAARRLRLPSVYTAHGWPFQKGAPWKQRVMSLAGEFVGGHLGDAVITLTEAERDRARRARVAPGDRVFVVPNGIGDVPVALRRGHRSGTGAPRMVMVARFAPPKLQAELVEALTGLLDLPWTLLLVGDGPGRERCEAFVDASPELARRVEFLGQRDDVPSVLAASDLGLLWSRYEGLPMSVMEYMRAGLCCVASDLPGTRALFDNDRYGFVAASPAELVERLRDLLTHPARVDACGAEARQRYVACYSVPALVGATRAVYDTVLARRALTMG